MQPALDVAALLERQRERARSRPAHIPFSSEEYAGRLTRLREAMTVAGVDMLLLSSPEALYWLHGYALRWYKAQSPREWKPLACTAVHVDHDRFILFEGGEHEEMVRRTSVSTDNRLLTRDQRPRMLDFIVDELVAEGWLSGPVGTERASYVPNPVVAAERDAALEAAGATLVDATEVARAVRRVKSPQEVACIERAAEICDAGIKRLGEVLQPGMTELEAWSEMMGAMVAAGGEPAALHEVVSVDIFGTPHGLSGRRKIQRGDLVFTDPCGVFERYHANRTATFSIGEPPAEACRMVEKLAGALPLLSNVAKAGTPVREVTKALRDYYIDAGLWEYRGESWQGGYELGASFAPDWVGNWHFNVVDENPVGEFEDGMVTNYESVMDFAVLDTFVYGEMGARPLSKLGHDIMVVEP